MSKYNSYAKRLNDLFHETATAYKELTDTVEAAEQKAQQYPERHPGTLYEAEKLAARAAADAAKERFRTESHNLFERYEQGLAALNAEFESTVMRDQTANPADIDGNALELLKSGIMTVSDFDAMLAQYGENATMSRLIHKFADERRQTVTDTAERQQMAAIAARAKVSSDGASGSWRELVNAAKIYSGAREPLRSGYVFSMQEHWDKPELQETIEKF